MQDKKPWWKSKTIWGVVATLWFALQPQLTEFFDDSRYPSPGEAFDLVCLLIATGWTIYGRLEANQPIAPLGRREE